MKCPCSHGEAAIGWSSFSGHRSYRSGPGTPTWGLRAPRFKTGFTFCFVDHPPSKMADEHIGVLGGLQDKVKTARSSHGVMNSDVHKFLLRKDKRFLKCANPIFFGSWISGVVWRCHTRWLVRLNLPIVIEKFEWQVSTQVLPQATRPVPPPSPTKWVTGSGRTGVVLEPHGILLLKRQKEDRVMKETPASRKWPDEFVVQGFVDSQVTSPKLSFPQWKLRHKVNSKA